MPILRHGRSCRGGSVPETLLVLALIALLILVAFDRFISVRVDAERLAMDNVILALHSAALQYSLQNQTRGAARNRLFPLNNNPMSLLARAPANYLGELAGPDPATLPGGQWYFDTTSQLLVYRVDFEAYFDSPLPGAARARFKLRVATAATERDGRSETGRETFRDITLEAVEPYSWRRHPVDLSALKIWGVISTSP